jgi:hypothetical protein
MAELIAQIGAGGSQKGTAVFVNEACEAAKLEAGAPNDLIVDVRRRHRYVLHGLRRRLTAELSF